MKRFLSLILVIAILASMSAMFAGCSSTSKDMVEESATVVTLYAQSFEQWSREKY